MLSEQDGTYVGEVFQKSVNSPLTWFKVDLLTFLKASDMRVERGLFAGHLDFHTACTDAPQLFHLWLDEVFVGGRQWSTELHLMWWRAGRLRFRVKRMPATPTTMVNNYQQRASVVTFVVLLQICETVGTIFRKCQLNTFTTQLL